MRTVTLRVDTRLFRRAISDLAYLAEASPKPVMRLFRGRDPIRKLFRSHCEPIRKGVLTIAIEPSQLLLNFLCDAWVKDIKRRLAAGERVPHLRFVQKNLPHLDFVQKKPRSRNNS